MELFKSNFQQGMVKVPKYSTHGLESLSEQVQTEMLRLNVPVERRIVRQLVTSERQI